MKFVYIYCTGKNTKRDIGESRRSGVGN